MYENIDINPLAGRSMFNPKVLVISVGLSEITAPRLGTYLKGPAW